MAIESAIGIQLVPADEKMKDNLIQELSLRQGSDQITRIEQTLQEADAQIFLVYDPRFTTVLGYAAVRTYERIDRAKEIILWLEETACGAEYFLETLRDLIRWIGRDGKTEQVVLRIEDNKSVLIQSAMSIGFVVEGIYISNQFLKGEFSFYSVYTCHL